METRGILDALCQVWMDSGLVQKEKLLAKAHRQSFAAVRQAHRCDWNLFLECVFRSTDVAFKIASCFVNKKDCLGLRTALRAFATCMTEASSAMVRPKVLVFVWEGAIIRLGKKPSICSTPSPKRGTLSHRHTKLG